MTTLGDMIYENATPTPTRLPGNATARRLYLAQRGTGAVSAAPAWTADHIFNVMDYGAVGDVSTNDSAAIQACIDAAVASGNRCAVLFPPAIGYRCVTGLTVTAYAGFISFATYGQYSATLIAGGASIDLLSVDLAAGVVGVEVRNLGLATSSGITAASGFKQTVAGGSQAEVLLEGIKLGKGGGTGFVDGIKLDSLTNSYLNNIWTDGQLATYDSGGGAGSGAGIKITGFCINVRISNIDSVAFFKGLLIGDGTNKWQGFEVVNVNTVYTPYGIDLLGESSSPLSGAIQIANVCIDNGNNGSQSVSYGIRADGVSDVQITTFYGIFNAAGAKIAIQLKNRSEAILNNIRASTGSGTNCIDLVAFDNCLSRDVIQTGWSSTFALDASCDNCHVWGESCCRVSKSGTQSVTTATGTVLTWETEDFDDAGIYTGGSNTRLTVPRGCNRVRLHANIYWASNSTGFRYITFKKNGTGNVCGGDNRTANANSQGGADSGVLDVSPGDYFEVLVEQTSGGNLDVVNVSETNFSMEIIR